MEKIARTEIGSSLKIKRDGVPRKVVPPLAGANQNGGRRTRGLSCLNCWSVKFMAKIVSNSFLLLPVRHLLLVAMHLFLVSKELFWECW